MTFRPRPLLDPRLEKHSRDRLPDTCTIERPTAVRDALGGETKTWVTIATNVPCRVTRFDRQAQRIETGDQAVGVSDWVVYVGTQQDVLMGDRITVGVQTFEPIDINDDQSFKISKRILSKEIRTG